MTDVIGSTDTTTDTDTLLVTTVVSAPTINTTPTRDQIRSAMLDVKPVTNLVPFGNVMVAITQPSIAEILDMQEQAKENNKGAMVNMIITYVRVPGTNEKVFDDTDYDGLVSTPFSSDISNLLAAFSKLTGVTVKEEDKS